MQNVTALPTMDIAEDVNIQPHMFVVDDVGNDGDNVDDDGDDDDDVVDDVDGEDDVDVDSPVYIILSVLYD